MGVGEERNAIDDVQNPTCLLLRKKTNCIKTASSPQEFGLDTNLEEIENFMYEERCQGVIIIFNFYISLGIKQVLDE